MDLVEIAHYGRIYPVMFLRMTLKGRLDTGRLKEAVRESAKYVPEILYSVDFKKGRFVNRHLTVKDVFHVEADSAHNILHWDLAVDTQLKIFIFPEDGREKAVIGMSHVLADGSGFLQYLYLLCAIYNGKMADVGERNYRDIQILLTNVPVFFPKGPGIKNKAICREQDGNERYVICCPIKGRDYERIREKAASLHVSMNDVLMTAYARVISRHLGTARMTLPCPADLRKLRSVSGKLTVGNMTGMYRAVSIRADDSFERVLFQVQKEIGQQREKMLCFRGISLIRRVYGRIPAPCLLRIIRRSYNISSTSYTNIGKIDSHRLYFAGCDIESCYITGSYRKAPDFQLSVSTFRDVCTLNCTLIGNIYRKREGEGLLAEIKAELLNWINGM